MTEEREAREQRTRRRRRAAAHSCQGGKLEVEGRHPAGVGAQCAHQVGFFFSFLKEKKGRAECHRVCNYFRRWWMWGWSQCVHREENQKEPHEERKRKRKSSGEYRNHPLCCGVQEVETECSWDDRGLKMPDIMWWDRFVIVVSACKTQDIKKKNLFQRENLSQSFVWRLLYFHLWIQITCCSPCGYFAPD